LQAADNSQATGFDRTPTERFPTAYWRTGDRIRSEFRVPLPKTVTPGQYTIWVGLYETGSAGALRLPITDSGRHPTGDGQVFIGTVVVQQ